MSYSYALKLAFSRPHHVPGSIGAIDAVPGGAVYCGLLGCGAAGKAEFEETYPVGAGFWDAAGCCDAAGGGGVGAAAAAFCACMPGNVVGLSMPGSCPACGIIIPKG